VYEFAYSECYEKVTMLRVGLVRSVFQSGRASLSFSLLVPVGGLNWRLDWYRIRYCINQGPVPRWYGGQYGRGRQKALCLYLHR